MPHEAIIPQNGDEFCPQPFTLREIIFNRLAHRPEDATIILGCWEEKLIRISLAQFRSIVFQLASDLKEKEIQQGDTVLLASFSCSNELANAILFAALLCAGTRVFIPIYPEVGEFEANLSATGFKAVIMPSRDVLDQKSHEKEKEVVLAHKSLCEQNQIPFWDSFEDFSIRSILANQADNNEQAKHDYDFPDEISHGAEAVIFTTSGTSGKSKLVVYTQSTFSISAQSWQYAGLFDKAWCGNPGFTPLFTHTIGIRHFINAIWTGQPACLLVTDWFIHKPEIARYFLLQMQPGHIVGGPALFHMLVDFFRLFPELKTGLKKSLKTLISIGAPYEMSVARKIKTALGLELHNGFGTTETQMVMLNQQEKGDENSYEYLGSPLPGVSVELHPCPEDDRFELYIKSAFQCTRIIGDKENHQLLATGDLVSRDSSGTRFVSRCSEDFVKDGFGVKIPLQLLHAYYPFLDELSSHIEWIPLENKPGLAAHIFLNSTSAHYSARTIREWIKNRNESLAGTLEPFEFAHRHLERVCVEKNEIPTTRKGGFSRNEYLQRYQELLSVLRNPFAVDSRVESVEAEQKTWLYKFSNPRLAILLEALRLDVHFERGEGDYLYYSQEGREKKVLDFVGGFGAGLLGHNHPVVHEALQRFLESGQPALNTQGSLYYYPSLLARKLSQLFGEFTGKHFKVQFANSGTEATEIALHHALYEWRAEIEKMRDEQLQRYGSVEELNARATWVLNMKLVTEATAAVVVVNNCFHGYTASARSLLNSKKQRRNFSGLLRLFPLHVDDQGEHWRDQVERYKADYSIELSTIVKENDSFQVKTVRVSTIIASIVEPVRGEGGIYPLRWEVADFLSTQSFPLIADEIQCGLGRTGTIPSYPGASYYLLGKSLGGGYEKIAAVLIDDKRFKSSFPQYYNSTFANGEMAACAGLAALETIVREQFAAIASRKGHELKSRLFRLAGQYPDVVESVQGEGLMIGIHFNKAIGKANILLRALCEHELLGYLLSGWMFHTKDIRVLPSLSKPDSIRLEPSVYITGHDMDELMGAVEELCQHLRSGNMYELFRFLMNNDPYLDKLTKLDAGKFPVNLEDPQPGAIRVGFIGNFTQPARELTMVEVGLSPASETGLRILFEKMQTLLEGKPIRLFSKNLMQGRVHFTFYILPFDTAHLEMVQRFGKKRYYVARIQEAVDRLVEEGARFISLGAHTSIISGNGLFVSGSGRARILTGNTLTVASCLYHARQYLARLRRRRQPVTIAITGANGNIGSGLAGCFGDDEYADALIFLIGNNLNKLERLRQSLFSNDRRVVCTTDLFALREANIILSCTNTNDPLIFAHHLDPEEQVFIIDIAVPGAVSDEVRELPNVEFNRDASTVYLPDDPGIAISTHTPVGKVFCCAAEVMLAAMYDVRLPLVGHVHPASIKKMMELAMREGLFDKKSYALPI